MTTDRNATLDALRTLQTLTSDTATASNLTELLGSLRLLDGDTDEKAGSLTDATRLLRRALRTLDSTEMDGLLTDAERALRRAL